jgi:DinB superfamily
VNDAPDRPERDETVDYYHPYIDLVPDGDIRTILEAQRDETRAFLESVPEPLATYRYAAGKWSVSEIAGHINDCERLYTMRAFWFARGMESPLPSFESELVVKTSRAEERAWKSHVDEFAAIRASTIAFFQNLPADAWTRRGVASGYPFSVRAMAYIAAGHVIHHTRILRERYL